MKGLVRTIVMYSHSGLKRRLRFDVIVDVIRMACLYSHGIRDDTEVYVVLMGESPPKTIHISRGTVDKFPPDPKGVEEVILSRSWPEVSFRQLMRELFQRKVYVLEEDGAPIEKCEVEESVFVIGDHIGLPKVEERFLLSHGAQKISLGKIPLTAPAAAAVLQYLLDSRKFSGK